MQLGGSTAFLSEIQNRQDMLDCLKFANERNLPIIMIGEGSNIIWSDSRFKGLVLVNRILGYEPRFAGENYELKIGSGENWDKVVGKAVSEGTTGIECLSLIPGTAGATPIQNVGAYGQEISQTLISVEAYDTTEHKFVVLENKDCGFGYRTSRFKGRDKGRFLIVAINLKLKVGKPKPSFYAAVQSYLDEHSITEATPLVIRQAVIAIREAKLPDPKIIPNTGSFFANPVVDKELFGSLLAKYPDIPHWGAGSNLVKLSAAWLIEKSGLKNIHDPETGMATWEKQPLVLVNEHAQKTADLLKFKARIVDTIKNKFNIELVQEPESLP